MPNAECRMPNAECRMPNAECRMPNAERRTPNAERRTPNAERAVEAVKRVSRRIGSKITRAIDADPNARSTLFDARDLKNCKKCAEIFRDTAPSGTFPIRQS
jgi:hypothetical protein